MLKTVLSLTILAALGCASDDPAASEPRYLLFQMFTFSPRPDGVAVPFDRVALRATTEELIAELGDATGRSDRRLGFSIGPLALDHTDDDMRAQIDGAFELAEQLEIAVAIHIDDSMFWLRRADLWSNTDNVEWTDWNRTVHPQLRIGWAPTKLAPKMCYGSPVVRAEIERIATDVIGAAVASRVARLRSLGKEELFAGVIAGWETRMQDDSQPPVKLGYCSLHHLGYSAAQPPANVDGELGEVVRDWAALWVESLAAAGVPPSKLYTHLPVTEMPDAINAPLSAAFNASSRAGFSVYPADGVFDSLYVELGAQGNPPWAMAEGTNAVPDGRPGALGWEGYLARLYGRGAALVNIFAWQDPGSLGAATRSGDAKYAYRKFLHGEVLVE